MPGADMRQPVASGSSCRGYKPGKPRVFGHKLSKPVAPPREFCLGRFFFPDLDGFAPQLKFQKAQTEESKTMPGKELLDPCLDCREVESTLTLRKRRVCMCVPPSPYPEVGCNN